MSERGDVYHTSSDLKRSVSTDSCVKALKNTLLSWDVCVCVCQHASLHIMFSGKGYMLDIKHRNALDILDITYGHSHDICHIMYGKAEAAIDIMSGN